MEKAIYAVWRRKGEAREELNARLRDDSAPALLALGEVRGLRLNLQDADVSAAEPLRLHCGGADQPDAVVQLWIDATHDPYRAAVDRILSDAAGRIAAWQVLASTIIRNNDHRPVRAGERTPGFAQLCFLKRPDRLTSADWRHNWQNLHTPVAVETQANFEYVQNLIVRPLIAGPQNYAAIVEECFPDVAMTDPHAFFDAVGDAARFADHTARMAESCARFIDAGGVDLLPTSQYDLRAPG